MIEVLLTMHQAHVKWFVIAPISYQSYKVETIFFPLERWENWGIEKLGNLTKVTPAT